MAVTDLLVRVREASFRYGHREILSDVSLDVHRGEILAVLGPNGCGKTTLLRCIAGSLTPGSGSVEVGGDDVHALAPVARARRIGFLFQDHAPSFPFAVRDVVLMGRAPHLGFLGFPGPRDRALADAALDRVGLSHLKQQPYTRLSGGERQLVLLARSLAQTPDVILLDEPTAHLDLRNQVLTLRIIRSLAADGMTMIVTTHDPNHALWFDGRAALMKAGRIVAVGPAQQIMTGATLTATYDVDVAMFSRPSRTGSGQFHVCSAWLPEILSRSPSGD
jgi:ABC-type cobalamin/Fe3+-siderophores transport system ATPase subunit